MMLYLNMTAKATLGNVILKNISQFEISESILEMSNTAKIAIPKAYSKLDQRAILDQFHVGSAVTIDAGYYREGWEDMKREFTGYIREIESDIPLVVYCDDETYPLRQNCLVQSYREATLKQVLGFIVPETITFECPDVSLGRFQIDKESSFQVLQRIKNDYGLYSRLQAGVLRVNLRDIVNSADIKDVHTYVVNPNTAAGNLVKKNELKFKRKEDFKLRVKVASVLANGKKTTVEVGNKGDESSVLQFTYPGNYTEKQLTDLATGIYNKRCHDGYSGTITGFGLPRTHAGDILEIEDKTEVDRKGKYLIEKVEVGYNESSGFSRKNTLSYKV